MNEVKLMQTWNGKSTILYEMLYTGMFDREVCFMRPKHHKIKEGYNMFRGFVVFKPQAIHYYLNDVISYVEKATPLNTYSSLAKYSEIPFFGTTLHFRKAEMEKWNDQQHHHITSYDCLIDIDSPSHEKEFMQHAKETAVTVTQLLDAYNIPYYLRFSGMGYHIIIPHQVFKHLGKHFNPYKELDDSIYKLYNDFTKELNKRYSELIDKDLHDSRRITKVPYSLVFYENGTYVCWAFKTRTEFIDHQFMDYKIKNEYMTFDGFQNCFRRGQTLFNADTFDPQKLTELLQKMKVIQ